LIATDVPQLRSVPETLAPASVRRIDAALEAIEQNHRVTIVLAIESGSRAWGFPSPDSDYDCRFLFFRRRDDYLSPWHKRDVIELPLDEELDINGWDVGKALKLLLKGNAVVIEWLTSPITYRGDPRFRDELLAFAARHADRERLRRHYLHLGEKQRRTYFADTKAVPLKKVFYALRPAAALRWLRLHDMEVPPMHFPTLMAECNPDAEVTMVVADLLLRKAQTRELGEAPIPAPLLRFIDEEFAIARATSAGGATRIAGEAVTAAEALFRVMLTRSETHGAATVATASEPEL